MVHNLVFSTFPFIITADIARCMKDVVSSTGITFICILVLVIILYFLDILKSPPDEHDLLELLADTCCKWYLIGKSFKVPTNTLQSIERSSNDDKIRLSKVIDEWNATQLLPFTWETVISAMENNLVNNKKKANEIRKHLGLPLHTTE